MSADKKSEKTAPALSAALKACRPHFMTAAMFSLFLNVLYLAPTLYMLQVYDRVVPTGGVLTLLYLTLILGFALITLTRLDQLRMRVLMRSSIRLDNILSGQILNRLFAKAAGGGKRNTYTNAMREFDSFKGTLSGPGVLALFDAPWLFIYLGLCFLLHPILGLLSVAGGGILALLTWLNENATHKRITHATEAMMAAYSQQEALVGKADIVRALGMRDELVALQMKDRYQGLEDNFVASSTGSIYATGSKFFRMLLQSIALGVGAWLAISHKISPGAIFAASLLMSRALSPLEQLIGSWRGLVKGMNSYNYLNDLFRKVDLESEMTNLPPPKDSLSIEGLTVVNSELRIYYLNGVTFQLNAGEIMGVMGPSGAGKTTLARVLVGADDYDHGHIRFDGADRRDWDTEKLAQYIGFLPQDTVLFQGTIRDNISRFESLTNEDSAQIDELVIAAAKASGAHDLILHMPKGYNTELGPNGIGLSAGQSQRIGLARALYRDPFLLVLDEPNSHLDAEGEALLNKAISDFADRGGAVVVIAHRMGILTRAHKFLLLQNGRVSFFGTRDQWGEFQQKHMLAQQQGAPAVNDGKVVAAAARNSGKIDQADTKNEKIQGEAS